MILSTILLLSPALSPLPLQDAEPQVVIRRQGVEQKQHVRVRLQEPAPAQDHAAPLHQHAGQSKQQAHETDALVRELAKLEAELQTLKQELDHTEKLRRELEQAQNSQRVILLQGAGEECEDCEDCENPQECAQEATFGVLESCESASSCEQQEECEDEEEIILSWASAPNFPQDIEHEAFAFAPTQFSTGVWTTDAPSGMAMGSSDLDFGCECAGCPLSSINRQGHHAAPQVQRRQVIRLGTNAPQAHAPLHGQTDHGFTLRAAPPLRVEQPQMRLPVPPPAPLPPQAARQSAPIDHRVGQLEQRLDRIEAMLSELLERR